MSGTIGPWRYDEDADAMVADMTLDFAPTVDIATLEAAAEALARHGEIQHAVALWAIVLRLRMELHHNQRRDER